MKRRQTPQEYVYPAVFHANEDGTYYYFPGFTWLHQRGQIFGQRHEDGRSCAHAVD